MATATVILRPATLRDVHRVAATMRQADRAEILASDGQRPAPCLRAQLKLSTFARVAEVDGEPLAMLGVVEGEGVAIPWMLTTAAVERHPHAFWCACKEGMQRLRERYPLLVQMIDARHASALCWAQRLGFKKLPAQPFGFAQLPFHPMICEAT